MTVKEFIKLLKTKPQNLQVAYSLYSEHVLLEDKEVVVKQLCEPREDGWLQDKRPDKPSIDYLVIC